MDESRIAWLRENFLLTTAAHQNEYLARHLLHEKSSSFGVKGISWDKKTRKITSKPTVHTHDELAHDLSVQIIERLKSKSAKNYSPGTVLIINCVPNSLILEPEWNDAIERVTQANAHLAFGEAFLIEPVISYSATLYGNPKCKHRLSPRLPSAEPSSRTPCRSTASSTFDFQEAFVRT